MEHPEIKAIIENILLAADQPVNEGQLQSLLADGTEKSVLKSILEASTPQNTIYWTNKYKKIHLDLILPISLTRRQ